MLPVSNFTRLYCILLIAMLRSFIFCLFFICILGQLKAQTKDSTNIFSLRDFYAQVLLYHPITKQSNLITDIAAKELLMTRGQFDPKAQVDYDTKEQGQKFYYSYWNSALKLPLWIGEIKAGYELNEGELISQEKKTLPVACNMWVLPCP